VDRHMSRRGLLRLGATGTGLAGLALVSDACGTAAPVQTNNNVVKNLKMSWWGSTERHKRTQNALTVFTGQHPDIKVDTQFSGWDGYWEKLGSQETGGGAPDVIQMDYSYINEYTQKGYVRALDDLVPKVIDLSAFSQTVLQGGQINGKLYGVNNGINIAALIGNQAMLQQLGIDPPDATTTWTDFAKLTKQIAKKVPAGVYGTEDAARNSAALDCWLRQRGKSMFKDAHTLNFAQADLVEWMHYWDDLRKAKAAAPADLQATAVGDVQNRLVARRKAVFDWTNSNQLTAYATMVTDQLALYMFPQGGSGSPPGQYLKPSQLFSMSATTKYPQESGMLIGALVTDPTITAILGSERGIPPSTTVREMLKAKAGPVEAATYTFIDFVSDKVGPLPPPDPAGGSAVSGTILTAACQSIAFGKATIDAACTKFFTDSAAALKK